MPTKITDRLAYFRKVRGLTQVQLSKLTGITQANISSHESGSRPVGLKLAKRFAKALKIDYHSLV